MVAPIVIGLIQIGRTVFQVAKSPAGQKLAQEAIKKFGGRAIKETTKKNIKPLTRKVLNEKTPSTLERVASLGKVKKTSPGRMSKTDKIEVGADRIAASKAAKRLKTIGIGLGIGGAGLYATSSERKKRREAERKLSRAELERDIERAVSKVNRDSKNTKPSAGAKDKGKTTSLKSVSVKSGDTLIALSKRHGVSLEKLKQLNPKVKPRQMQIGSRIKLR